MRKLAIAVGILVLAAAAGLVGWRAYSGPPAPPAQVEVGEAVADFTLPDPDGKTHSLAGLRGEKGSLLIFVSTRCPVSNRYNERTEALHRDYAEQGIRLVGINANRTEPVEEVRSHAQENGLMFTILKYDRSGKRRHALFAQQTLESLEAYVVPLL